MTPYHAGQRRKTMTGTATFTQKAVDYVGNEEGFEAVKGYKGLFIRQTESGIEIAAATNNATTLIALT